MTEQARAKARNREWDERVQRALFIMYISIAIIGVILFAAWLAEWKVYLVKEQWEDLEACRVRRGHVIEGGETGFLRGAFTALLAAYWVVYFEAFVPMVKEALRFQGHFKRSFLLLGGGP